MKVYKKGDKITVKNLLKVTFPFHNIKGGETKTVEIASHDDIIFRGLGWHLEIVKKPIKKALPKRLIKKKVKR